ncbi:unnamed protein product [Symbiodinium sp. CCMP2592]|nr:unnamed protein product [Symbiodinium sp. CCMP2592]
MHMWCVTLEDLRQFRRLVMHAVAQGEIRPHARDMFDSSDLSIGPSVYTVTDQFIKPVTALAGGMSWALLKNPTGVDCHVFMTHCWAEGIYEFIDRAEYSWPAGAEAAYVCFLSNPQNLDISSLIASPSSSPFALALRSASTMLVLPNATVSIYTRLWCVYEAFLAYTQGKVIKTAALGHDRLRLKVLRAMSLFILGAGGLWTMWLLSGSSWLMQYKLFILAPVGVATALVGIFAQKFFLCWPVALQETALATVVICVAMFYTEVATTKFLYAANRFVAAWTLLEWLFYLILSGVFAADWARLKDTRRRSEMLRNKFSGRLLEAQCSSDADRASIHHELFESGNLHQVEVAVNALLRVNFLTPELIKAADLVGEIGDSSTCPQAFPLLALNFWLVASIDAVFFFSFPQFEGRLLEQICLVIMSIEAACWMVLFMCSPPERRIFAVYPLQLWILCYCIAAGLQYVADWPVAHEVWMLYPKIGAFCLGPFCLFMLIAGPIRVARVPLVGHMLVRRALRGHCCSRRSLKTPESDSSQGTAKPCRSTSTVSI